jgi:phosphoglycerol transferase MdoB-like AlkP superfamily enzyme
VKQALTERFAPVAALVLFYLVLGVVLRTVLHLLFGVPGGVSALLLPPVLAGGVLNDAVEALYLFLPLGLLVGLLPDRLYRRTGMRRTLAALAVLICAVLLFLAVAEYFFFEEFDARFNIVAFDYLMYPTEVIGDIRSEYPVGPVLLAALALALAACALLRRWLGAGFVMPVPLRARLAVLGAWGLAILAAVVLWPTDRLSFANHRVTNELVQNGHSSFFRAVRTSELDYHAYYRSGDRAANLQRLAARFEGAGGRFVALDQGRIDREFAADPTGLGKLNVVLVSSESFGAEFSRLYGSERDWTPNFDRYARQSVWFRHAYASGARTVRGLEALTASFPPTPPESIVRRPGGANVTDWGDVMRGQGYHTSFLYGGYGYFDNMNAFYGSNGFEVLDRAAIDKVRFENVWGVADEDLFDRALEHYDELDGRGQPFFSIIMTTSNHKPFTFRPGLEAHGIQEKGGGREAGVRYADYAVGQFLDAASRHRWFDNTIFIVIADHGARVYGRQEIPLKTYEIPALIYSPKHLQPRQVDTLFGQIDLAPTVLGMLGLPYRAPFFGIDVLHHPDKAQVAVFNHNHDIALMQGNRLVVLGLNRTASFVDYDPVNDRYAAAPRDTALEDLAIAYYQTAFELFRDGKF